MKLGDLMNPKKYALEVLDMFLHKQCDLERTKFAYTQVDVWNAVKMARDALKATSHGEWVGKGFAYRCSVCGKRDPESTHEYAKKYLHYCPNCGAKMDGGKAE